jgi:hypothetical protein
VEQSLIVILELALLLLAATQIANLVYGLQGKQLLYKSQILLLLAVAPS